MSTREGSRNAATRVVILASPSFSRLPTSHRVLSLILKVKWTKGLTWQDYNSKGHMLRLGIIYRTSLGMCNEWSYDTGKGMM